MTDLMARPSAPSWRARLGRIAEAATTPLVPADYLDLLAPLRPGTDLRARVVSVHPETRDAATLVLKPGADWAGHVPGQYLRIGVDVDGVREWRAYSLTHGPRADGLISITVKAVPDGKVSNHLVHRAQAGTTYTYSGGVYYARVINAGAVAYQVVPAPAGAIIAKAEGFHGHARAIEERLPR